MTYFPMQSPKHLGEALDAGEITPETPTFGVLVEVAFITNPCDSEERRAHAAAINRRSVEAWVDGEHDPYEPVFDDERQKVRDPGQLAFMQWQVDLYDDPSLAERLWEIVPLPMREDCRRTVDTFRRPHPLEVRDVDTSCASCGTWFSGAAVVVGDQTGLLEEEIAYCRDCIGMAASALNGPVAVS